MASDQGTNLSNLPVDQQQIISNEQIHFSIWDTFKHHIPRFLLTIIIDLILPLVLYFSFQKRFQPVYALLIAGAPPLIMVIIKAILLRTFDALGFLVFIAFLISAIVALVTHNPIVLLLEKSIITGILSLIFGLTLIPLECCQYQLKIYPLAYYFYHDLVPTKRIEVGLTDSMFETEQDMPDENDNSQISISRITDHKKEVAQVYQWIYKHCSSFRWACYMITSIWSIGFLFEFLARLTLILAHLSINKILIYGHVILTVITIICILLTIICITNERKQTLTSIEAWKRHHSNIPQHQK